MYDLLLKGGRIYDGSGLPSFHGDVAIADGKIVEIGRLNGSAKRTLNVDGLGGGAGFYRSAYAYGRTAVLGPDGHFVLFPWRDFRRRRQLRPELGAGETGEPRFRGEEFRARRSD